MKHFVAITVALIAATPLVGGCRAAQAQEFKTEYTIAAFGFRVGSTEFRSSFDGSRYAVSGTMRARGVARLFTTTSGALEARGRLAGGGVATSDLDVRYVDDGEQKRTTIAVRGGAISAVANDPEVKETEDWVETPVADLVGAVDPIAAALVSASSMRAVCDRTIRMFDGAMRFDLRMRYLRTIPFSAKGYKGDAVTCRARFVPVSGYAADREEVAWARDNLAAEISFAPVGETGLYTPVRALIDIGITEIRVTARRFERLDG